MKKALSGMAVLLFFFTACATVPKTPVSFQSIQPADLLGTWEGHRIISFDRFTLQDLVVLEVTTVGPPVKGNLTVYPSQPGQTTNLYPIDRGEISADGKLILPLEKDISVHLGLFREPNVLLLEGDFNYRTNKGRLFLRKK